ncbi:alpha/beta hydrolase family protein [Roseateles sp. BYS78W]|uniref:Alpha/beta hydrolase family protein n=1 Tax=Pelomonas candidula TaxID=3299025 RepID=A0ABW7HJA5_9BURK
MLLLTVLALLALAWAMHSQAASLLAPSGTHAVGRSLFRLNAPGQRDPMAPMQDAPRELMVWVWYPADAAAAGQQAAPYLPAAWREAIEQRNGWLVGHVLNQDLAQVHAHAIENAAMAADQRVHPVVVLRPGGAALTAEYSTLAEDLASHGYVVVGFDAPYRARVVVMPDGRVLRRAPQNDLDLVTGQGLDDLATRLVEAGVNDIAFVLDELARLPANEPGRPFAGHLDLGRIAVVGHSLGGATAAQFCHDDARCKAGIDIDGALFGGVVHDGLKQPFMFLLSDHGQPTDAFSQRTQRDLQSVYTRLPAASRQWVSLPGANHFGFSDVSRTKSRVLTRALGVLGLMPQAGDLQLEMTRQQVESFLDRSL